MISLSINQIKLMHTLITEKTGGSTGVRDEGLLESALYACFQTFGGKELYPSIEEKAAAITYSLVSNHAFTDGNKRIGVLTMLVLLKVNGIAVSVTDDDIVKLGLGLADNTIRKNELLSFINEHKEK